MNIIISNSQNVPIYEQIYTQLINEIINGNLRSGDALPSIRSLAKDLRISVITTQRAYDELVKQGYIFAQSGKGFFVADTNMERIRENNLRQIEEYIAKIKEIAPSCNLSEEDIIYMIKIIYQEEN